jgi:mono/diheme cytochrome c family protein
MWGVHRECGRGIETACAVNPVLQMLNRGIRVIREKPFVPPDFDEDVLNALWTVWPEPEHSRAEAASPDERRKLTFSYYGITPAPQNVPGELPALGYTRHRNGWTMNCLACHGGKLNGTPFPGLPNSHYALQTLVEDVRLIKLQQRKKLSHLDLASLTMPLSTTNGSTNSVIFGVVLGALREPDMTVDTSHQVPELLHHDVDPPPFWNVKKKTSLYADGFAPKTHRPLMQFMLLPSNSKETVYGWETDFQAILEWIESVEAPKYPWPVDAALSGSGKAVFETHCARCHGTYGPDGRYEQQTIAWQEVRTDRARLDSLTPEHRAWMQRGWMSHYGEDKVDVNPQGYVAPPLDGIWASGPYFHNGSVPTLWHVLHPQERPAVWKRTEDGYDQTRVGLEAEIFPEVPKDVVHPAHRRRYFDTGLPGKSAQGHDFPNALSEAEKRAVLEYLKTL